MNVTSCKVNQPPRHAFTQNHIINTLAITTLSIALSITAVEQARADISGLTYCGQSKAFTKRKNQEIKELQKRMKKYEADSAPTVALKATMERTEKRFEFYAKSGLLCGTDGLPHLIADPGFALKNGHAGDVFIPTLGFFIFRWLAWSLWKIISGVNSKQGQGNHYRRSMSIGYFGQSHWLAIIGCWRAS